MTGSAIKRYREQANMTQAELSHQLETVAVYVCRGSISRIEQGVRIVSDILQPSVILPTYMMESLIKMVAISVILCVPFSEGS